MQNWKERAWNCRDNIWDEISINVFIRILYIMDIPTWIYSVDMFSQVGIAVPFQSSMCQRWIPLFTVGLEHKTKRTAVLLFVCLSYSINGGRETHREGTLGALGYLLNGETCKKEEQTRMGDHHCVIWVYRVPFYVVGSSKIECHWEKKCHNIPGV